MKIPLLTTYAPLQTRTMADCSICYNKIIDHPAPPEAGTEATGSFRSSCGHLFHPKCIWTWFSTQDESSCPLCRKKATELEDIREHKEEDETAGLWFPDLALSPAAVRERLDIGPIRISRANFEQVIFNQGGPVGTWVAEFVEEVRFDEYGEREFSRAHFEGLLWEVGARRFSDAEWDHLVAIYPAPAPEEESETESEAVPLTALAGTTQ